MLERPAQLPSLTPRAPSLTQGAPSARSLLLTILGEWVLPGDRQAWTSALIEAMAAVGVEAKTARQAIARSASAGLLVSERHGRRTRWRLTEEATRLLVEGTERIYSFGREQAEWDGRWILLLASVPGTSRHLRYRLRTRLAWAGFAAIGWGDWLSPWVERESEARAVLQDLGLAAATRSFIGALGSLGDPKALACEAWNLDQVEEDYESFIAEHRPKRPTGPDEAFSALTLLVHEWRHFPSADPGLPAPLLPRHWSGQTAARMFHRLHHRWSPAASQWWRERNDG